MKKKSLIILRPLTVVAIGVYILFRINTLYSSLDENVNLINKVLMTHFFLSETFILLHSMVYFINIIRATLHYERKYVSYAGVMQDPPAVSVIIPTRDEPISILRRTIVAAKYMDYPNFDILIIDASSNEKNSKLVSTLCKEQEINYFLVPYPRSGGKAGSINRALNNLNAKYLVVFDADHRPSRSFIKLLVPQMEQDTSLAYIQTPQFYGTLKISAVSRASELQQSIFYEYICEGKSVSGGMFLCGTNFIIRTDAIKAIGGFDEESITEDFSTSYKLLNSGWKSKYYNFTTAFGDGPLNLTEYFRQQYRWARGTFGVFLKSLPSLLSPWKNNLQLEQRIEFIVAGSYYYIGVVWLTFLLLPITYIFFRVPVYFADPRVYALAYLPNLVLSMGLFFESVISRKYKIPDWIRAQSLAYITVPIYVKAVIDSLFMRQASFQKTNKDVEIDRVNWNELSIQFLFIAISILAIIWGVRLLLMEGIQSDISLGMNIFWTFIHLILFSYIIIILYVEGKNKRNANT